MKSNKNLSRYLQDDNKILNEVNRIINTKPTIYCTIKPQMKLLGAYCERLTNGFNDDYYIKFHAETFGITKIEYELAESTTPSTILESGTIENIQDGTHLYEFEAETSFSSIGIITVKGYCKDEKIYEYTSMVYEHNLQCFGLIAISSGSIKIYAINMSMIDAKITNKTNNAVYKVSIDNEELDFALNQGGTVIIELPNDDSFSRSFLDNIEIELIGVGSLDNSKITLVEETTVINDPTILVKSCTMTPTGGELNLYVPSAASSYIMTVQATYLNETTNATYKTEYTGMNQMNHDFIFDQPTNALFPRVLNDEIKIIFTGKSTSGLQMQESIQEITVLADTADSTTDIDA